MYREGTKPYDFCLRTRLSPLCNAFLGFTQIPHITSFRSRNKYLEVAESPDCRNEPWEVVNVARAVLKLDIREDDSDLPPAPVCLDDRHRLTLVKLVFLISKIKCHSEEGLRNRANHFTGTALSKLSRRQTLNYIHSSKERDTTIATEGRDLQYLY